MPPASRHRNRGRLKIRPKPQSQRWAGVGRFLGRCAAQAPWVVSRVHGHSGRPAGLRWPKLSERAANNGNGYRLLRFSAPLIAIIGTACCDYRFRLLRLSVPLIAIIGTAYCDYRYPPAVPASIRRLVVARVVVAVAQRVEHRRGMARVAIGTLHHFRHLSDTTDALAAC